MAIGILKRISVPLLVLTVGLAGPPAPALGKTGKAARASRSSTESLHSRKAKGSRTASSRTRRLSSRRVGSRVVPASRRARRARVVRRPGTLIPSARVLEIQSALIARGFLSEPPSGQYDQATVAAMKAFQTGQNLDATGYPTAHTLKRLGMSEGPAQTPVSRSDDGPPAGTSEIPATSDRKDSSPSVPPRP